MDNFFRGSNTVEYWDDKYTKQGDAGQPHDFSQLDDEAGSLSYHKVAGDFMAENHEAIQRKTLLEIGCSFGFFTAYLKEKVIPDWDISGWDFGKVCIESAAQQCPSVNYDVRDILLNPVDEDYGIISMFETIEHLNEGDNYATLDNILEHCEYAIISTVDTQDDGFGEHVSHYTIDSFDEKGYDVYWKAKLAPIRMPDGIYHYIFFIIKGKLNGQSKEK